MTIRFYSNLALGCMLFAVAAVASAQSDPDERFKRADQNNDGSLSEQELGPNSWQRLHWFDADENGLLTHGEWAVSGSGGDKSARRPGGANLAFEAKEYRGSNGHTISYSLYSPKEANGRLPLLVCLHGRGGSSHAANVAAGRKVQSKTPCFVMAPECDGRTTRWVTGGARSKPTHRSVLPDLLEAIDRLAEDLPIDRNRIYLTGQSMGGVGTWGILAEHPRRFAAAAPVCGTWDPEDAAKMKDVPLWAFHGELDTTVPPSGSRDMIAAMKAAGGKPKYTELPGVGHGSWEAAYDHDEFWTWLFRQSLDTR